MSFSLYAHVSAAMYRCLVVAGAVFDHRCRARALQPQSVRMRKGVPVAAGHMERPFLGSRDIHLAAGAPVFVLLPALLTPLTLLFLHLRHLDNPQSVRRCW